MSGTDESQPNIGNGENVGTFLTSAYDGNIAYGAPVASSKPPEKWQQDLSVDLDEGRWVNLFQLQPYRVARLMDSKDAIHTINGVSRYKRDQVEAILIQMFCESSDDIPSGVRNLRKYRTSEQQTAIVLTSSCLHRYTEHPIVLIVEEAEMPPRPMSQTMLLDDNGGKGDKLTAEDKQLVREVLGKLLQGIPITNVEPPHFWLVDQQQNESEVKNCHEPFKAYVNAVMAETMLTIYYRHNLKGGISGECFACDTVEAMVKHVSEVCDTPKCPQRQFLVKAYAQHVKAANCGSDCSIPFCCYINHLVRPQDVENPSPWLTSVVVKMIKLKRAA